MTRPLGYTVASGGSSGSDPTKLDKYTTQSKTASFTAAAGFVYLVDTTSGAVTATLPAANVAGQQIVVKWVAGTNAFTVTRSGSDTIGAATTSAPVDLVNEVWELTSSGSGQWNLTGGNKTLGSLDARFGSTFLPSDHSLLAWSQPIELMSGNSSLTGDGTAGTLKLSRIRRVPAVTVTNVNIFVGTAGSGLSNCFAALYTASGTLVAQTSDQSSTWQSTGRKAMALSGGPYAIAAGDYYVGLWYNGTTAPSIFYTSAGWGSTQVNLGQSAGSFNAAVANTGLTGVAPASLGTQTAATFYWWTALS